MEISLGVEGRAGDAHHPVLLGQLDAEGIVLAPGLSLFVFQVFLRNVASSYIGDYEVASLWNPEIEVKFRLYKLG